MKTLLAFITLLISFSALSEDSPHQKTSQEYYDELTVQYDQIHRDSQDDLERVQNQMQRWDEEKTNRAARSFYERENNKAIYGGNGQ